MESDKTKARRDSPDYAAGSAEEKRAEALFQGQTFKGAADGFIAAGRSYARAIPGTPPAPTPPSRTVSDDVRDTIASYERAYESKDMAGLRRLVPGYSDADIRKLRDYLAQAERIHLDLSIQSVQNTSPTVAVAKGRRRESMEKDGRTVYNEGTFEFTLVKTAQGWHIQALK